MNAKNEYNSTVCGRIDITPRLSVFRVNPDGDGYSFIAGQYTVLGLKRSAPRVPEAEPETDDAAGGEKRAKASDPGRMIKRAYSLTSDSRDTGYLEFYVSLVTSGELTPRLFMLGEGDRLFVGPRAKGLFTMEDVPDDMNILLIATGTGLAPYVSMLRSNVLGRPAQSVAVVHGASYSWDLGYRGELEVMSRNSPNLRYAPIVSRPDGDPDWRGRTGRLTPWLSGGDLSEICAFEVNPETTHIFLCGHPRMVDDAQNHFEGQLFARGSRKEPGNLHLEKYW
ncbi:MAG: ferredoxin--NADP reductase [Rhodospirillales bacterium]